MSRKRRPGSRPEMLSRDVEISSFRMTVRLHAVHGRGEEPYIESQPWLELLGTATEPVRDVKNVRISMYPQDELRVGTARPAAVGAIVGARPELSVVLTWPHLDFDRPGSRRPAQVQPPVLHETAPRSRPRGERVFFE